MKSVKKKGKERVLYQMVVTVVVVLRNKDKRLVVVCGGVGYYGVWKGIRENKGGK